MCIMPNHNVAYPTEGTSPSVPMYRQSSSIKSLDWQMLREAMIAR
jgi:hypothetical protein